MSETSWTAARLPRRGTAAAVLGLLLIHLATLAGRPADSPPWADGAPGTAVAALAALVLLGRGVLVRRRRPAFLLLGLGALSWTAGDLARVLHDRHLPPVPHAVLADAGRLGAYPLLIAAVLLLARSELRGLAPGALVDAAVGALSCAAAGTVLVVQPALSALGGPALTRVADVASPVLDLLLAATVVGVLTLRGGGRPPATWLWLAAGTGVLALTDALHLHALAAGTPRTGAPLDALWPAGLACLAVAATCAQRPAPEPDERVAGRPPRRVTPSPLPNAFGAVAVGILGYGSLSGHRLPVLVVALTAVALGVAVKRTAFGVTALRLLAASERQAQTDELTQLSNRRHFDREVQRVLLERTPETTAAVVMVDLDGFKKINDTFGHHIGDEVLRQVAGRLRRVLRAGDLLARLGGDEFGLLLVDGDRPTAAGIGERLVTEVRDAMLIDGHVHTVGASVGIAICPDDGEDMAALLQRADLAMFDAKAHRKGAVLYDPAVHADHERLNVRTALLGRELVLHYQPQIELSDGSVRGVEAVVRWAHPTRGLLMPDTFLAAFEQAGMMADLTLDVLRTATADWQAWRAHGRDVTVSVNLPPSALMAPDLVESLRDVLAGSGMPPESLTLEVVESTVIADLERCRRVLLELRALGVQLSLDDYGTGFCSLTYLRDLPLHEVKIDQSFVRAMLPGSADAVIVESTLRLAAALGLRTVAEGVETSQAFDLLGELGCDAAQGYLLGMPVPAADLWTRTADRAGAGPRP